MARYRTFLAVGLLVSCIVVRLSGVTAAVTAEQANGSSGSGVVIWPPADVPTCPFGQSDAFNGLIFSGRHKAYDKGDGWFACWAADGNLYSGYNYVSKEGAVNSGCARISGDDPMSLKLEYLLGQEPSRKPMLSFGQNEGRDVYYSAGLVHDGVWYYGTYCLNGTGKGLNEDELGVFLGFTTSDSYGKSWDVGRYLWTGEWEDTSYSWKNSVFHAAIPHQPPYSGPIRVGAPHFVDFGKDMEHSPDGKAYLVGHGVLVPDPKARSGANTTRLTGDAVYLARVTPSVKTINARKKYEFFAGHDPNKQPIWTSDFKQTKPLADWNDHMGAVSMTYNAPLKKYFMCVTDGDNARDGFNSYILESDNITGPWRMVTYMEGFGKFGYFLNIPSKFISSDGRTAWLCYSTRKDDEDLRYRNEEYMPHGGAYAMTLMEFKLMPADTLWNSPKPTSQTSKPYPGDGEVVTANVKQAKWTPGIAATAQRLYFGTEIKPDDYTTISADASTLYLPALKKDTVYRWRVDEVRGDGSIVAGKEWSFSTSGKLLGWWKLDGGSETIAEDCSGNGFDGKVAQFREGGWIEGKVGGARNFDGGDTIEIPAELFESVDEVITIAFWVNGHPERQPRKDSPFEGRNSRNERILNLHLPWEYEEVHFDAGVLPNVSSYPRKYDKMRISKKAKHEEYAGRWNHWVATKNAYSGEMKLYLNGKLWHNGTGKTQSIRGITKFNIGSYAGAIRGGLFDKRFYYGMIDDFRIYDYELRPEEIKALYEAANLPQTKQNGRS
jgi:hypothetical protein